MQIDEVRKERRRCRREHREVVRARGRSVLTSRGSTKKTEGRGGEKTPPILPYLCLIKAAEGFQQVSQVTSHTVEVLQESKMIVISYVRWRFSIRRKGLPTGLYCRAVT